MKKLFLIITLILGTFTLSYSQNCADPVDIHGQITSSNSSASYLIGSRNIEIFVSDFKNNTIYLTTPDIFGYYDLEVGSCQTYIETVELKPKGIVWLENKTLFSNLNNYLLAMDGKVSSYKNNFDLTIK